MIIPMCYLCQHYRDGDKCAAFPAGIPGDILFSKADHRRPYPGDRGIRFLPSTVFGADDPAEFFPADLTEENPEVVA